MQVKPGYIIGIFLGVVLSTSAQVAYAQQALKIGVVDYFRVINESVDGKKANDTLKKEFEPIKAGLRARESEMKKLEEEIKRQKDVLSAETMREKTDTLKVKYNSYLRAKKVAQEKFQKRNGKLLLPILEELKIVVSDVGKKGNYSLIFEHSTQTDELIAPQTNIVYSSPAINITDELLNTFNAHMATLKK